MMRFSLFSFLFCGLLLTGCGGSSSQNSSSLQLAKTITGIAVSGTPIKVFDHTKDQQQSYNIPDGQVTAWREADGTMDLTIPSFENYRMRGTGFANLTIDPHEVFSSETNAHLTPEADYNYAHWLMGVYTLDGKTYYAMTHSEWYACLLNSNCNATVSGGDNATLNSWVATPNEMISTDGGADWQLNTVNGSHTVAALGYAWTGSTAEQDQIYLHALNHTGVFQPSRIIQENGYYYSVAFYIHRKFSAIDPASNVYEAPVDGYGYILMRTNDLTNPGSWQIWQGGSTFGAMNSGTLQPFSPMVNGGSANAAPPQIIYDQNAQCYILIFTIYGQNGAVYYMTTKSLATPDWSAATTITGTANIVSDPGGPVTGFGGDNYVSIIDESSAGYNFEFTTGSPQLFFSTFPSQYGGDNLARDLYRLPLTISYQ